MKELNVLCGEQFERTIVESVGQILFMCLKAHDESIVQVLIII